MEQIDIEKLLFFKMRDFKIIHLLVKRKYCVIQMQIDKEETLVK